MLALPFCLTLLAAGQSAPAESRSAHLLETMPEGYRLQAYDDCGIYERQPHVRCSGVHTYQSHECEGDAKALSVAWDYKQLDVVYDKLEAKLDYAVAVTYANETFNTRAQSIRAGPVQLQGAHTLPKGKSERLIFRVPRDAIQNGTLTISFKLEGAVNVVVSVVELWAPAPSPKRLHFSDVSGLYGDLEGQVLNLAYDPQARAKIELTSGGGGISLATTETREDGWFTIPRGALGKVDCKSEPRISASIDGAVSEMKIPAANLFFDPVRYRPMPVKVAGLERSSLLLDGEWRINPRPTNAVRQLALSDPAWGKFKVPGQWTQQGCDAAQNWSVAVAHEFIAPPEWKGCRVMLRFDAIHAGTHYWLNGKPLGYSERLFAPVEWDITDACRPGESNRLDLEMRVDTVSEQLSYSSGYAFHNLGGIDRSARIYALPETHARSLRVLTDLDKDYGDAELTIELDVAGQVGAELGVSLTAPDGSSVLSDSRAVGIGATRTAHRVSSPLKWTAETPHLYRLTIELKQEGKLLERIERSIGFRKIEVRGRQLYVNGRRVKLAGACRHETDPVTGRADTAGHAEEDVKLLKAANLNYIRTSHYPPCQEMLDAADRIGMYVEVEAPFCWVNQKWTMKHVAKVLDPTSAMIDYCHTHPCVTLWSLANESAFCRFFKVSNQLVRDLDPTRPTTFNNPDPWKVCDIANLHYPPMPYADAAKGDNRPALLGEFFFPVCHEQKDVSVNPGLRGLWAAGHSDPDSEWGRKCDAIYARSPYLTPGGRPGAWTYIMRSDAVIGGAIWAAFDEPFYLPGGRKAGYMWVHGPWGLIDGWRRPKPEWWLSKLLFSPAWFPKRRFEMKPGQASVEVPVENRYSFTDLKELKFSWEGAGAKGTVPVSLAPGAAGSFDLPVPPGLKAGDPVAIRVTNARGEIINTLVVTIGMAAPARLPEPAAGPAAWRKDGDVIAIDGDHFGMVIDAKTGRCRADDPRHTAAAITFPTVHITRFDFGDLMQAPPYAVLPDEATRVCESVDVTSDDKGLQIAVRERYDLFAGSAQWTIDKSGVGRVKYDYGYTGPDLYAREVGIRLALRPDCDTLRWRRWSEWGVFPEDDICRTEGVAKARRDAKWPEAPENSRPDWPWSQDQTPLGTNDFRGCKFHVYEASLTASSGTGLGVHADADAHVRACASDKGILVHVLSECNLGPVTLKKGDRIAGERVFVLLCP